MIYLIRHGQTDWNLFNRANGITDTFLNAAGLEQAKQLASELKEVKFNACFCSPQTRARQFCEIIYKGSISFDDRLTEINCGEFEGMEETAEMMQSFWYAIKNGDKGTEHFEIFGKRNFSLCDLITHEYKGKNVLIVTHAANARVINYYFSGQPKDYDFSKGVCRSNTFLTFEN